MLASDNVHDPHDANAIKDQEEQLSIIKKDQ